MSTGLVSRSFGRVHALGPWLYFERGGTMIHFYARWFWLPYQRGYHWGFSLRINDRYRVFKTGQHWAS